MKIAGRKTVASALCPRNLTGRGPVSTCCTEPSRIPFPERNHTLRTVLVSCLCGGHAVHALAGAGTAEVSIVRGVIISRSSVFIETALVTVAGLHIAAVCFYPSGALQVTLGRAAGEAVHLSGGRASGGRIR
jgi:hypothetical protein